MTKSYAQSIGYEIEIEEERETYSFLKLKKSVVIEHDKIGDMIIEHTRYKDDTVTDEYIYFACDCTLFAREARELANEFVEAAIIAESLDLIYNKKKR